MAFATRKPPERYHGLVGYLVGQMTEELAKERLMPHLPKGAVVFDGHDPFHAPNFGRYNGAEPKNLDLVVLDPQTGNITAIYEVKSTTLDKTEFEVNGQCGIFMTRAQELSIPIHLIVVRMDRQIAPDVLKVNARSEEYLDESRYKSEKEHFSASARFELYSTGQFEIREGKFVITGECTYI